VNNETFDKIIASAHLAVKLTHMETIVLTRLQEGPVPLREWDDWADATGQSAMLDGALEALEGIGFAVVKFGEVFAMSNGLRALASHRNKEE
jgi:hypothetical protein